MQNTVFPRRLLSAVAAASLSMATLAAAQQPAVAINDDEITLRGCVGRVQAGSVTAPPMMVWTRGDLMLSNPSLLGGLSPDRVFYWLDDDDDLSEHIGQLIEVRGDLGDFEKGEVEFDKDGDFTEIELKLDGRTEKARVPTTWLGAPRGDAEFDIVTRKIDVDDVKVLGACPGPVR
jgi:hypothetical protein